MTILASCTYKIEKLASWQFYTRKIEELILKATQQKARILLLPEYAGVEIACGSFESDENLYATIQPFVPRYIEFFQNLAKQTKVFIQPGTIIEQIAPAQYTNRAYLFSPQGSYAYQDKLHLTEFEKNLRVIIPGTQQTVFDTPHGKIGIAICYDSEFPETVRQLTNAGATIILVPSYTSSMAGFNRVFLSCRARAIENQCYVAVSFVVDKVELSGESEITFGQAAILGPADKGFPDDGILAAGKLNEVSLVSADVSQEKIADVRAHGQVLNFTDVKQIGKANIMNITI